MWLYALTLAAFAVQTDDFIIVGVLPEISADLGVPETAAGQLVTVYSLIYALTAPLWALLLSRISRRAALPVALGVFGAANFAVLLVDGFAALMALRVVAALAAAVVLPAALAAANAAAPEGRRGRYLATVMTGLTGAILLGVPAGTWIGAAAGWRATFVFAGALGLVALVLVMTTVPDTATGPAAGAGEPGRARDLVRPLLNGTVSLILVATVLTVAGNLAFQTYLAPYLTDLAGVTPRVLAVLLVCSGAGGILGTQLAGRLVDRYTPLRALIIAGSVFCAAMLALVPLWASRPVPVWLVAVVLTVWSASAWAVPPSIQALMLVRVGDRAASQAMAVHSSSAYVGAALGGALGGAAVAVEPGIIPVAAAVLVALGLGASIQAARSPARAAPGPAAQEESRCV
ncbi:MFS transporter [Streptomyces yaizuensis]|uniref:MFS transporter n=1 Tax=Streptomyces yaizuensis TaxID=2989713 RepID=A0ABQ5P2Q3_9ACTN|nr:MFS transporter [Streptomyces sp. YSPA8]GLF96865.1 MFS transporter [Streptomyces sp. YSPA8]